MKKKVLSVLLAASCVFAMTACGGQTQDAEAPADASAAAETGSDEGAAEKDVLVMATNATFPPYEYVEGDGYAGIDVEISERIAEELGMTLEIDDIDFGSIITSVQTGKADMGVAGMTVNEERLQNVNFSDSYATGVQVIIVQEGSKITSDGDLFDMADAGEDFLVGVQENTTGHIYCSDDLGEDHVVAYTTGANAVEALKTGKVDCVIIDNEPAKSFVAANEGLQILDTTYVVEDYAIAIAKENTELLDQVNAILAEMKEDGSLQAIIDKYIKAE